MRKLAVQTTTEGAIMTKDKQQKPKAETKPTTMGSKDKTQGEWDADGNWVQKSTHTPTPSPSPSPTPATTPDGQGHDHPDEIPDSSTRGVPDDIRPAVSGPGGDFSKSGDLPKDPNNPDREHDQGSGAGIRR
jgi:hypothetical protein